MEEWLKYLVELQSLAQVGLEYTTNCYDKERFQRIREITCEIMSKKSGFDLEKVNNLFANEEGYQTPKIDTRAVIFKDNKILLVKENNGLYALPGGWCDVLESIRSNTIKEVYEEAGLVVTCNRLLFIHDRSKRNIYNSAYRIMKTFVLCDVVSGEFKENIETLESKFFALDEIPENLALEKTTLEQIKLCFDKVNNNDYSVDFD